MATERVRDAADQGGAARSRREKSRTPRAPWPDRDSNGGSTHLRAVEGIAPDPFAAKRLQDRATEIELRQREIELKQEEIRLARNEIAMEREEAALRRENSTTSLAEFSDLNQIVRIALATVFLSALLIAGTIQVTRGETPFFHSIQDILETGR